MTRDYDQNMKKMNIWWQELEGIGQIYNDTFRTGCQQELRWTTYMHTMDFFDSIWTTRQCDCCGHERLYLDCIRLAHSNQHAIRSNLEHGVFERFQAISEKRQGSIFHHGKFECSATSHSTTTPYDSYLLRLPPSYSLWLSTTP